MEITLRTKFIFCSTAQLIKVRNSFSKIIAIFEPNFEGFSDNEEMVFLLEEKSKLITNLTRKFVYDLFEKQKNQLNSQTL